MAGRGGRIQGGAYRGIRLESLPDNAGRPSTGKLKEALFSMLGPRVPEAVVIDCFAGTGALGLEALSRGAAKVVFVESSRRNAAVLERNLAKVQAGDRGVVRVADALKARSWGGDPLQADLILADPPYGLGLGEAFLTALDPALLAPGGWVALEHEAKTTIQADPWNCVRTRVYGESALSIFEFGPH